MNIRYPEMHDDLRNLALDGSKTYTAISTRELIRRRGEVTYYFQGHVEANDLRLGSENAPHIALDWDWRILDTYGRNETNSSLWDLTLTKAAAPDAMLYDGQTLKVILTEREAQRAFEQAQAERENLGG